MNFSQEFFETREKLFKLKRDDELKRLFREFEVVDEDDSRLFESAVEATTLTAQNEEAIRSKLHRRFRDEEQDAVLVVQGESKFV